jgi:hypothetical protein
MCSAKGHVRFAPKSGYVQCKSLCLLWAISGHSEIHFDYLDSNRENAGLHCRVIHYRSAAALALDSGSIRQQDGQGCIFQDVLGRSAEYPLSQSALRVGTLDKQVAAQ